MNDVANDRVGPNADNYPPSYLVELNPREHG